MTDVLSGDVVLEAREFSYCYDGRTILDRVSFSLRRGEYATIVGPNGAGKTTLLKCCDNLLSGGTGDIFIAGRSRHDYHGKDLAKLIAYVPQADGRKIPFTVEQFLLMSRYPHLSPFAPPSKKDRQFVRETMECVGVADLAERTMSALSGGERQKAYIAAALAQDAPIWLLDEPTTFLDYRHQQEILSLIATMNREREITILSVTHDLNHAVLETHRVIALKRGKKAFDGPPEKIMQAETLREIYDVELTLVDHPDREISMIVPGESLKSAGNDGGSQQ